MEKLLIDKCCVDVRVFLIYRYLLFVKYSVTRMSLDVFCIYSYLLFTSINVVSYIKLMEVIVRPFKILTLFV